MIDCTAAPWGTGMVGQKMLFRACAMRLEQKVINHYIDFRKNAHLGV